MTTIEKKKRGRKPKKVDFDEEMVIEENSFEIKEQLIIHLPIKHEEIINIDFNNLKIEEAPPVKRKENFKEVKNPSEEIFTQTDRSLGKLTETKIDTFMALPLDSWDFKNSEFVPKKTDICCWWCTYNFDTYPVYMPLRYMEAKDYFKVKGIFCSFECCAAYGLKHEKNMKSLSLVKFLYKRMTKSKGPSDIKPSPPKEILKKYGGPISIEEYRLGNHCLTMNTENIPINEGKTEYFIHEFPVKYIPTQVGSKRIKTMIDNSVSMIKRKNKKINLK